MTSEHVSIADAAARWVSTSGFSPGARDARRWDLCVVARTLADSLGRPPAPSGRPAYVRELRRLGWNDLQPSLVSVAIADFGVEHAPVTHRRVVANWSSFLRWLGERGYPVPVVEPAPLPGPETRTDLEPRDVGRLVAETIRGGRRTRDAWPERDRAIVGVIVAASLSLANVSGLLLDDLEREGDRTRLRSRNRQGGARVVELPAEVWQPLDAYLASRRARPLARAAPQLFVHSGSGKPYTPDSLRYLYVGWFRRAGVAVPRTMPADALRPVYAEMMQDP